MVEIYKATLTKADLDKIPSDERTFYLVAGQLANDINILGKLVIFSSNKRDGTPFAQWASLTQTLLLIKIFAGRLFEGNVIISKLFFGKKLRDKYIDELNPKATDGLNNISKYFRGKNSIKCVRDKFAFHYDATEELDGQYAQLPSDTSFVDLLSAQYIGHNLFYGAELLSFHAMATAFGEAGIVESLDTRDTLDTLMKDTTQVAAWMGNFITDFLALMRQKYVGLTIESTEKITITEDCSVDDVWLPFFCGAPKNERTGA